MVSNVEMPPLPEPDVGMPGQIKFAYSPEVVRACVAVRDAEIERLNAVFDARERMLTDIEQAHAVETEALRAEVERLTSMARMQAARADAAEREASHRKARAERLAEALHKIAAIAHSGGLINLSEAAALTAIRRLSLPYWGKEEKPEQVRATLAAQHQEPTT